MGLSHEHVYRFLTVDREATVEVWATVLLPSSVNVLGLPAGQQLESCCCQQLGVRTALRPDPFALPLVLRGADKRVVCMPSDLEHTVLLSRPPKD